MDTPDKSLKETGKRWVNLKYFRPALKNLLSELSTIVENAKQSLGEDKEQVKPQIPATLKSGFDLRKK